MKGYVKYCEDLADMHWTLWLWAHDEHRTEDAVWHHGRYQDWTRAAWAEEQNYESDLDDDRSYVDRWKNRQFTNGIEWVRDDEEQAQYTHD